MSKQGESAEAVVPTSVTGVVEAQPLVELQAPEAEHLGNSLEDLARLSAQLQAVAKSVVKRGDITTKQASSIVPSLTTVGTSGIYGVGVVMDIAGSELIEGALATVLTTPIIANGVHLTYRWIASRMPEAKNGNRTVDIPGGYTIQCLRANENNKVFTRQEPVALIHPRVYADGEQEAPKQARDRLVESLTVATGTTIDKVVVPTQLLRTAQLPDTGTDKPYGDTLLAMKLDSWVNSPYATDETSVVLTRNAAQELIKQLSTTRVEFDVRTEDAIVTRLARQFPLMADRLQAAGKDDAAMIPLLHRLLRQTMERDLPSAERERGNQMILLGRVANKTSKSEAAAGAQAQDTEAPRFAMTYEYYDRMSGRTVLIDTSSNPLDPVVQQVRTHSFEPVFSKRLSEMVDLKSRLMNDIGSRLKSKTGSGEYSIMFTDTQLIAIALNLIEARQHAKAIISEDTVDAAPKLYKGGAPIVITTSEKWHPASGRIIARRMCGLIALGAILGATTQAVNTATDMAERKDRLEHTLSQGKIIWQINEHGFSSDGLYTQNTFDHYDADKVEWTGKDTTETVIELPRGYEDKNKENLIMGGVTNSAQVDLPIKLGTKPVALVAKTRNGTLLETTAIRRGDGTWTVRVNNDGYAYQLIFMAIPMRGKVEFTDMANANRPLTVADEHWNDLKPDDFAKIGNGSIDWLAHITRLMTYDASEGLQNKLSQQHTANGYVHTVFDGERCDCVECATAVALLAKAAGTDREVLLATGYRHADDDYRDNNSTSYLETSQSHAWLVDETGRVIDGTAQYFDENSNTPKTPPKAEMEERMKNGGWDKAANSAQNSGASAATAANARTPGAKEEAEAKQKALDRANEDQTTIIISVIGILASAVTLSELRKPILRRRMVAAARTTRKATRRALVNPGKAAAGITWHQYGGSKMKKFNKKTDIAPSTASVSTDALLEIARSGLRKGNQLGVFEKVGVRMVARALLKERLKTTAKSKRPSMLYRAIIRNMY